MRNVLSILVVCVLLLVAGVANAGHTGTFVEAQSDGSNLSAPLDWDTETVDNWNYKEYHGTTPPLLGTLGGDPYSIMSYNDQNGKDESCPVITITESGLASSAYDVYFQYWDSEGYGGSGGWYMRIQAGLSGGPLATYDHLTGTDLGEDMPMWSGQNLREVFLGTTGVTTSISVDVDDVSGGGFRSMWEGFSYVAVPEPMTISVLALGALAILVGRRRK